MAKSLPLAEVWSRREQNSWGRTTRKTNSICRILVTACLVFAMACSVHPGGEDVPLSEDVTSPEDLPEDQGSTHPFDLLPIDTHDKDTVDDLADVYVDVPVADTYWPDQPNLSDGFVWDWMEDCDTPYLDPEDVVEPEDGFEWDWWADCKMPYLKGGGEGWYWDGSGDPPGPPCKWEGPCACDTDEDCIPGWQCEHLPTPPFIPNAWVCVFVAETMCMPCNQDSDCINSFEIEVGQCRDFGGPGKSCIIRCDEDADCPLTSACLDDPLNPGNTVCLPQEECWCSDLATDIGAWSLCNEDLPDDGCADIVECTDDGLSDCYQPGIEPEICDGIDNNCNGEIDEFGALECDIWFLDSDADGFGGNESACLCEGAEGYVPIAGDCDDENDQV